MGVDIVAEKFNLQDRFLNTLRLDRVSVKVYLVNGFQLKGVVKSFDSYTILLESENQQSLIYKHAISTIIPSRKISWVRQQQKQGEGKEDESKHQEQ